jgi:hypothetical protein
MVPPDREITTKGIISRDKVERNSTDRVDNYPIGTNINLAGRKTG